MILGTSEQSSEHCTKTVEDWRGSFGVVVLG